MSLTTSVGTSSAWGSEGLAGLSGSDVALGLESGFGGATLDISEE